MRSLFIFFLSILLLVQIPGCAERQVSSAPTGNTQAPSGANLPPPGQQDVGRKPPMPAPVVRSTISDYQVQNFVTGLDVPWDMVFLPGGRIYVTERPGRIRLIENGRLQRAPYAVIGNVSAAGEGGLMGIARHPNYPNPRWIYAMYTYRSGGSIFNRVSRFTDTGRGLTNEMPVITRIPGATIHDGGIIRFGPDGMLYVGTGDAGRSESAQNLSSLAGKILKVTPEGNVPGDNPFQGSRVYAYGLRNVQGLAWNPANGDLWATNHGPSAMDSIFIVRKGGNHGWPRVLGVTDRQGVVAPILFYPEYAVAPARALFYTGNLMPELKGNFFFTTLRGEHLQRVVLSGTSTVTRIERWWQTGTQEGRYGRLRALAQGPDGSLYVATCNTDGRGSVRSGDDRILRITPR